MMFLCLVERFFMPTLNAVCVFALFDLFVVNISTTLPMSAIYCSTVLSFRHLSIVSHAQIYRTFEQNQDLVYALPPDVQYIEDIVRL